MTSLLDSTPLFVTGVFLFGLLIGSFLNVVIARLPARLEHEWQCQCRELLEIEGAAQTRPPSIIMGRSRCPHCGHAIAAWENIPLLSFAFLKGKCSNCKKRISWRYPAVELLTAAFFAIVAWSFGPSLQAASALVLTAFLIAATGIDFDHQLLPDNLTLPLMWAGLLISLWSIHTDVVSSLIGAAAGYLSLWTVYHVFKILTGKEGMGYGDFKLMAALGAWLGWQTLPLVILLSSVIGALVGLLLMGIGRMNRERPMPFGPFIAMAGWVALIWGDSIISTYLDHGGFG